jgi:hypothetical protein
MNIERRLNGNSLTFVINGSFEVLGNVQFLQFKLSNSGGKV